jgi:hypothetical protein
MAPVIAASTGWWIGFGVGIVVVLVVATIVTVIVGLALRISKQAQAAVGGIEQLQKQTDPLSGVSRINDSGVRILHSARALRKVAVGK